jgi:hypothetical protein
MEPAAVGLIAAGRERDSIDRVSSATQGAELHGESRGAKRCSESSKVC